MDAFRTIEQGTLRGATTDGVCRFLGIPYAAAPVGQYRFQAPAPAPTWDGERDATKFGPTSAKPGYRPPFDTILIDPEVPGDECLNLNVWAPAALPEGVANAPVMVWIHGGAFVNGSATVPVYDGTPFARDGIVYVSLNYRLGVDGFAYLPDAPANRGLLDQIAALEWVQRNIAAFGGDRHNVTVFGESAGAMSITMLLSSARTAGLFAKAITQSGATQAAAAPSDAALVTADLAARLGVKPTAAGLAEVDTDTLLATATQLSNDLTVSRDVQRYGATVVASAMAFIPVVDGELIAEHPITAFFDGANAGVPLLTGTNTDEEHLFLVPTGITGYLTEEMVAAMVAGMGAGPEVLKVYQVNRPGTGIGDVCSALLTDAYFRLPAIAVAEARRAAGGTSYVYEFAQPTTVGNLGACHALEIGFVFDNLHAEGNDMLAGDMNLPDLAATMHQAWIAFARTGEPGWPAYDEDRQVMVFVEPRGGVVADPRGDERAIWTA